MWWLIRRCGGSLEKWWLIGDVVTHSEMWWLIGDVVAHSEMWWLNRDVVVHWLEMWWLICSAPQTSGAEVAESNPQWFWCAAGSLCKNVEYLRVEKETNPWGNKRSLPKLISRGLAWKTFTFLQFYLWNLLDWWVHYTINFLEPHPPLPYKGFSENVC